MFIFYSLAGSLIKQQQSKAILNSTNDFVFSLQNQLLLIDEDLRNISPNLNNINNLVLDSTSIDFVFTLVNDSLINNREFKVKTNSVLNIHNLSFKKFFNDNPNLILKYSQLPNGKTVYYGSLMSAKFLDRISEKIRAEIAIIIDGTPYEVSNSDKNQSNLLSIITASRFLKFKNSYSIFSQELENEDFVAVLYSSKNILTPGAKIDFVVFNAFKEGVEFRATLRVVMLLIILAGSAITFILVILFTAKLRKQISLLSLGAEITGKGDLEHRVPIITKDEIGHFGVAFNRMLDELARNKKAEHEYSEFIALINQNPTLKEISDAALTKIIKSMSLTFGVLYIVEEKSLRLISSYGISRNLVTPTQSADLYSSAIEKKERIEFQFHDNFPEIKTGIASIKIKYLMIIPVVYNKETIAVLEIASESIPQANVQKYIDNIHEQLAVGLVNAKSFEQLENLVNELRDLNEEYQKQNKQIVEQNSQLKELHLQLKEKAGELERQRSNAVELTKVKSEFLASMSHELRTPLISILGLTELLMKDSSVVSNVKDRLKIVYRNGKKLFDLISNILEFSKFESGKIEIKKESFLLGDLLEEIQPTIGQLTFEKSLSFSIETPKDRDILINTDRTKIEQILLNLLVNAVKFTELGSIKLIISPQNVKDLEFKVIDTGIGISEENKKVIFNEFRQVDNSTSRKYGGAGLGLAICKKYVELLGSNLQLTSEIGKGTQFRFILPDSILEVIEKDSHQFLTVAEPIILKEDKLSVLLITDNLESQRLIGDYLNSYQYDVVFSSNKQDGFNTAKQIRPTAVVLNPFINDKDIWSLIIDFKSDTATKDIPMILTMILEEEKVGWEPDVFDFILTSQFNKEFPGIIKKVESHFNYAIRKAAMIGTNINRNEVVRNSLDNVVNLSFLSETENILQHIKIERPQLIVINFSSLKTAALDFVFELSNDKATKNIPVIFEIPDTFPDDLMEAMTLKSREITLKAKSHPMDVLKVLRDRLGIDDEETNKKINLIEEQSVRNEEQTEEETKTNKLDSKATVLIVDDDSDALFTIGEYVKEIGCNTIFAHNGMECLLTLNHIEPALILLDIMMPQMDGFETIKRIRSDKRLSKIPVIALTAYAMLDNKEIIEKNGFDDLVTKPIDSKLLSAKLNKILNDRVFSNL
jgi:signal transduction histidine kinase/CheY-like chemotaxis protein